MFFTSSGEHNEAGILMSSTLAGLPESLQVREAMVEKRMRKLNYAIREMNPPKLVGEEIADITIVSWGSTKNIVREAMKMLEDEKITVNHLHIKYINPFHTAAVKEILENTNKTLIVEQNFTGQMRDYIRMKTGFNIQFLLNRYDGEPLLPTQIVDKVKEVVKNE
ncbi:MAG: transketolase C-terminal domain-containing protein [Candidatus Heimdallarchaeaceae archaeon]|jgi:2-oxoglutarate ferredoxin oxidoreductase subunit alpha